MTIDATALQGADVDLFTSFSAEFDFNKTLIRFVTENPIALQRGFPWNNRLLFGRFDNRNSTIYILRIQ
jgi:hypothetical protein